MTLQQFVKLGRVQTATYWTSAAPLVSFSFPADRTVVSSGRARSALSGNALEEPRRALLRSKPRAVVVVTALALGFGGDEVAGPRRLRTPAGRVLPAGVAARL